MCVNNKQLNTKSNPEDVMVNFLKKVLQYFKIPDVTVLDRHANADELHVHIHVLQTFHNTAASLCISSLSSIGSAVGGGVRGQAGVWHPGPFAPEIPVPPAAAAERSPGPPASDGAETAPSGAAPPTVWSETSRC